VSETRDRAARPESGRLPGWLLGAALLALAAGLAVVASFVLSGYEVVEKGQILPYTEGKIYKVRFGNGATLLFEPEIIPTLDLLNGYLLTGIAFISLTFGVALAVRRSDWRDAAGGFFMLTFLGASALALDEVVGVHESLGHNLQFLSNLPGVDRPDDALILFMAVPAVLFLFLFRGVILVSRRAVVLFAVALALFLISAAADFLSLPFEEPAEVLATVTLAAATVLLGLDHLRATDSLSARTGDLRRNSEDI